MTELWALLWSKKSNGFHCEPLEQAAKSGKRFYEENMANDYLLIAYGPQDYIDRKADALRPLLVERDLVQKLYGRGE